MLPFGLTHLTVLLGSLCSAAGSAHPAYPAFPRRRSCSVARPDVSPAKCPQQLSSQAAPDIAAIPAYSAYLVGWPCSAVPSCSVTPLRGGASASGGPRLRSSTSQAANLPSRPSPKRCGEELQSDFDGSAKAFRDSPCEVETGITARPP